MKVDIRPAIGNWDLGFSLDKQVISSRYVGENEWGKPMFDTTRSDIGECLYQLKSKNNFDNVETISNQIFDSLAGYFKFVDFIVPMPPSKHRYKQPVIEIARELSNKMKVGFVDNFLIKKKATSQLKDIDTKEEKIEILFDAFGINDELDDGSYNVLIVDDLFDTGASLEAATMALKSCEKIQNIYVAAVTRTGKI